MASWMLLTDEDTPSGQYATTCSAVRYTNGHWSWKPFPKICQEFGFGVVLLARDSARNARSNSLLFRLSPTFPAPSLRLPNPPGFCTYRSRGKAQSTHVFFRFLAGFRRSDSSRFPVRHRLTSVACRAGSGQGWPAFRGGRGPRRGPRRGGGRPAGRAPLVARHRAGPAPAGPAACSSANQKASSSPSPRRRATEQALAAEVQQRRICNNQSILKTRLATENKKAYQRNLVEVQITK